MKMLLLQVSFFVINIGFSMPINKNKAPTVVLYDPENITHTLRKDLDHKYDQENVSNILIPKEVDNINSFYPEATPRQQYDNWARHSSLKHRSITDGHRTITEGIYLKIAGQSISAEEKIFQVGSLRNVAISFADIILMSGEFFGAHTLNEVICNYDVHQNDDGLLTINSEMPEEEAKAIRKKRAQKAFDRFYSDSFGSVERLTRILKYFKTLKKMSHQKSPLKFNRKISEFYAAIDAPNIASSLLNFNTDHFGGAQGTRPCAQIAYTTFHNMAIDLATEAKSLEGREKIAKLKEAYFAEGFGLHYATDQFSSGYLRTPAFEMRNILCNKIDHASEYTISLQQNEDSNNGLLVINAKQYKDWFERNLEPVPFLILGDKQSWRVKKFDTETPHWQRAAIQYGIDEVYHAFLGKLDVAKSWIGDSYSKEITKHHFPGALLYTPNPLLTEMYMDSCGYYRQNSCPLYTVKQNKLFRRSPYSKLYTCQSNGRYSSNPSFHNFSYIQDNNKRNFENHEKSLPDEFNPLNVLEVQNVEARFVLPGGCGEYISLSEQNTCINPSDYGNKFFSHDKFKFYDSVRGMLHQYLIEQDLSKGIEIYNMEKVCSFPPVRDLNDEINSNNREVAADTEAQISDDVYVDVEYDDEHG